MRPLKSKLMECIYCSTSVLVPPYRQTLFKYCSRSCSYKHKTETKRVEKECVICKTKFSVPKIREKTAKYCSNTCYYKGMAKKGSIKHFCHHCNSEFLASPSVKRKFCSKQCVNKSSKETWNPAFTTIRAKMASRSMITACARCGYCAEPKILGVHHKDRDRNNNSLANLEVLCPNCHSLEHMKHTPHGFKE